MPDTNDLWPENIADSNLVHPGVHLETTGRAAGREDSPVGEGRSRHSDHRQPVRPLFLYCRSHAQLQIRIVHPNPTASTSTLMVMKYLNNTISINSESEFKDKLEEIFAAPHTLNVVHSILCLLYTSPSPRDRTRSRM